MRFNTTINNVKAHEWGLNIQQAYLFAWFYELPSWADKMILNNKVYYFASKTKAVQELPLLTEKTDTMYRYYKQIESLGLIEIKKIDNKDYVFLTEKAKSWNGSKSEYSEKNPNELGNISEHNSEINPTYNNNNINNKISNNNSIGQNKNFDTPTQENQIDLYDVINEVENENNSLNTEKEKRKKVAPKKEKEIFIDQLVLEGVLEENAIILANERVKNKKSVSSIVYKNIIKECKENNIDINHAVEVMVIKGWQGFKAQWYFNYLKENNNGQQINNTNGSNTDSNSGANKIDRESLFKRLAENHEMRNKFM